MCIKPDPVLLLVVPPQALATPQGGHHRPCYTGAQRGDLLLPSPSPHEGWLGTCRETSSGACDPDHFAPTHSSCPLRFPFILLKNKYQIQKKIATSLNTVTHTCSRRPPPAWKRR